MHRTLISAIYQLFDTDLASLITVVIKSVDVQDLDVEDEGLQCPPSPLLFDTALALEDQTIREIAEAPMDILTGAEQGDLDGSTQDADLSERDEVSVDDQVIITVACWDK